MPCVGILLLSVVTTLRAQSVEPIRIVSADASSVVLDFTLTGLREGVGSDGLPALTFDGATLSHSHDHESHASDDEAASTAELPLIAIPLGLPPDSTPTVAVITQETERIPVGRFPFLASDALYREQELAAATVSGYVRDQYIGRVVIRPVAFAGASLSVTTRCRVRVTFSSVPAAPSFGRAPMPRSDAFEGVYQRLLVNYDQARGWRKGRPRVRSAPSTAHAANSRIRLRVDETALYRVSASDLRGLGVEPAEIDPATFRMTYRDEEVGIDVIGVEDGVFDGSDRIIFFGEHVGHSRFTTENAYLLWWNAGPGIRPTVKDGSLTGGAVQTPEAFRGADYFEIDRMHAELVQVVDERADHYFWTAFTGGTRDTRLWDKTLPLSFPTEANNIPRSARLRIGFQGGRPASFPHRMQVTMNNQQVLDTKWTGQNQHFRDVAFDQAFVSSKVSFRLINLDDNDTANAKEDLAEDRVDVYLDWFEVDYWREFRHTQRGVLVSSKIYPALQAGPVRYQLSGYPTGEVFAYELGDAGIIGRFANVRTLRGGDGRLTVTFQDVHSVPTRYMVAGNADIRRPVGIELAPDSGLRSPSNAADYLIITHADFLDEIQPLADYRRAEGHDVKVVGIESVYNDFSHGVFSPFAIQNLLRYAYQVWETPPEYVLLVGDAHYDYKGGDIFQYAESGIVRENYPNYVPTIHSWGGDASGETAMDHRFVTIEGDDPLPDMFIGRFPVQLASEVRGIVRKIVAYESNPEIGLWQTRMAQVADDDQSQPGDQIFQNSRDALIKTVIPPAYDVQKIYLKDIGSSGATKQRIREAIADGALVVEYAGHGGRDIWADEDILRLWDVVNLRNGRRQPLIVATTCQMNLFDQPETIGERAMGEQFLLGEGRGAIAVIGATRKTFARCNAIFDAFLFPEITSSDTTEVGRILTQAKIQDWVTNNSVNCLPGLEQYTLFGDPATRLARPGLLANVEVAPRAVNPGQQFALQQGFLFDPLADPPAKAEGFDGEMTVTVKYPNNLDSIAANDLRPSIANGLPVFGGEYGDVEFTVPADVEPGEAALRIFARSGDVTAIGGERFSVRQSRIDTLTHRRDGEFLVVTATLANPSGVAGIQAVELKWHNNKTFVPTTIPMNHLGGLRYENSAPIPLPGLGRKITYTLTVTDKTGSVVKSDNQVFQMPLGPDLAILELGRTRIPEMSYGFEQDLDKWAFRVVVVNRGDLRPEIPAEVIVAVGDADSDGNWELDDDADVISRTFISLDSWTPGLPETGEFERAEAVLPVDVPLVAGVHEITVWIDPALSTDPEGDDILGRVGESKEFNNRTRKPFSINNFSVGDTDTVAYSLDRTFEMNVPGGAAEPTTLSISLDRLPDEERFETPESPYAVVPYLRLTNAAETVFRLDLQSGVTELTRPATLQMSLDFAALRSQVDDELDTSATGEAAALQLRRAEEEALARTGIYEWLASEASWRRLDSRLRTDEDGDPVESLHVTPPQPSDGTQHNLRFGEIGVDQTTGPSGEWVVYFVTPTRYDVMFLPEGANSYQRLAVQGALDEPYADASVALRRLVVRNGDPLGLGTDASLPAAPGETLGFTTAPSEEGVVSVTRVWMSNAGDGTAEVGLRPNVTLGNAPYGDWILMVTGDQRYEVRSREGKPVLSTSGSPLRGTVNGPDLILSSHGLVVRVLEGSRAFQFGDTFRVRVGRVMTVEAETPRMGTYTLLRDIDGSPPTVQVFVNDLTPQSGEVIPPRPTMTLLLSDPNGINVDTFRFERQKLGETAIEQVDPATYTLNPRPVDQVSITHRPILFIGTYLMRVYITDLAGMTAQSAQGPFAEFLFLVEEDPDLEPPTFTLSYEGGVLENGQLLTETPQEFTLHVQESHALDIGTLEISVGVAGHPPEVVVGPEVTFDRLLPDVATATWTADLTNGEYDIQARIDDTSTNVGFLGGDEATPFRLTIDEPVHFEGLVLNAPNPFSPFDPVTRGTFFTYNLTQPAEKVSIRVYTVAGRLARVLADASGGRGYNETYWDGRDDDGVLLSNGVYFYKVRTESAFLDKDRIEERVGKLVILR